MTQYVEKRSAHALAVDRGMTAKTVYERYDDLYRSAPNQSDVRGYDTKQGNTGYMPAPAAITPKVVSKTEYVPTQSEREKLLPYFHKLNPIEQHKDLLVTKNVVRTKEDVEKWKQNPKYYDVRGIDTQPKELIAERLKVALTFAGNPTVKIQKYRWKSQLGEYSYHVRKSEVGSIRIDKRVESTGRFNQAFAHEIGHAYDRNTLGKLPKYANKDLTNPVYRTGNTNFGALIQADVPNRERDYGITQNSLPMRNRSQVMLVTQKRINPYNPKLGMGNTGYPSKFSKYRNKTEELFADWFSGLITQKNMVKRQSRGFYNIFRKANKPLVRALRKSDAKVTQKYLGRANRFM